MAIVRNMQHLTLERDTKHMEVNCTYSVITDAEGARYLQIDTYGSAGRQIPDKKSQSIRFSPEAIEQLKALLGQQF